MTCKRQVQKMAKEKRLATIRFKKIVKQSLINNKVETQDTVTTDVDYYKILKFLTEANVSFRVGIKDNTLVDNYNYIEVFGNGPLDANHIDKNEEILSTIFSCKVHKKDEVKKC